jgi:hypothetical protein
MPVQLLDDLSRVPAGMLSRVLKALDRLDK